MNGKSTVGTWRDEYPFESHFLEIDTGERMHYIDEGSKETGTQTILCVHGNPTWSFYYRKIVSRLRDTHRVIAIDHIGCGLIRLIDFLDLKNVTLVVHDWGGAIGLGAAVQRVNRFSRLFILNTAAFPPPYIPRRIAMCRIPLLGSWAIRYCNAFARAAIFMAIDRLPQLDRNAKDGLLAPYDSPQHRVAIDGFVRDIPMSPKHPTYDVLMQLERALPKLSGLPVKFVWGMKDWCFRPECMERLNLAWPNATRRELSDVGHYVMEEAPTEVVEELHNFADKHVDRR
jgi:cis-3-alkyl-4-acyloxetan-2-one decarboxylase